MRTKNPWVRALRFLEGWYVRFMIKNLWFEGKPCIISVFTWFLKEFLFESANLSNKLTETDEKTLFLWINF
jgi:hypothetical protein